MYSIFCIYYFVELFYKAEAQPLSKLASFWIASVILFNTILTFPMMGMVSFKGDDSKLKPGAMVMIWNHIKIIFKVIIVFANILFSIGFLFRIRIRKSTL